MDWIPAHWMGLVATGIFTATYLGVAVGGVPGLAIDRTGIALLGAIAMVATGALAMPQALQAGCGHWDRRPPLHQSIAANLKNLPLTKQRPHAQIVNQQTLPFESGK